MEAGLHPQTQSSKQASDCVLHHYTPCKCILSRQRQTEKPFDEFFLRRIQKVLCFLLSSALHLKEVSYARENVFHTVSVQF